MTWRMVAVTIASMIRRITATTSAEDLSLTRIAHPHLRALAQQCNETTLLGLYDSDGELRNVGGASAFTNARRLELIDELAPLVIHGEDGEVLKGATDRSRFSGNKDVSFVRLEPTRVIEVSDARFQRLLTRVGNDVEFVVVA